MPGDWDDAFVATVGASSTVGGRPAYRLRKQTRDAANAYAEAMPGRGQNDDYLLYEINDAVIPSGTRVLVRQVGTAGGVNIYECAYQTGAAGGGVTTVGAFDGATHVADGAFISGTTIYFQSADPTHAGMVNTGTQAVAGNKQIVGTLTVGGTSGGVSGLGTLSLQDTSAVERLSCEFLAGFTGAHNWTRLKCLNHNTQIVVLNFGPTQAVGTDPSNAVVASVNGLATDSTGVNAAFGVSDATGNVWVGAYATVSGLVFKGGLYVSGSLSGGTGTVTSVAAGTGLIASPSPIVSSGTLSVSFGTTSSSVCVGNDTRLSDARTPTAHAATHEAGGTDAIPLDTLAAPTDITALNVSTGAHGLCPKLPNDATKYLNGTGAYTVPAGAGGGLTSVGLAMPTDFAVANSPLTANGTITVVRNNTSPNYFLAGPASGSTASAPAFRAFVAADLPPTGVVPGSGYNTFTVDLQGRITSASTTAYLTANQAITLSGDVTGSGATAIAATVARIQGVALNPTAPADQQVLLYDGASSRWTPARVSNNGLAQMLNSTIKGNNSGATNYPVDLTPAQVRDMLPTFTGGGTGAHTRGLVPDPGVGTASGGAFYNPNFLRADASFILVPGEALANVYITTNESTNSTSYTYLTTADGFNFYTDIAPLDVVLEFTCNMYNTTATGVFVYFQFYDANASAQIGSEFYQYIGATTWQTVFIRLKTTYTTSGSANPHNVGVRVHIGTANSVQFQTRLISARVGA